MATIFAPATGVIAADTTEWLSAMQDTTLQHGADSIPATDLAAADTTINDSIASAPQSSFLDDVVLTNNQDSLIFDVKKNHIKMFSKGNVKYKDNSIDAEFIEMKIGENIIYAYGKEDSVGVYKQPVVVQGSQTYNMDTVVYNTDSEKMMVKGVVFQEGEGYIRGKNIKKIGDEIMNIGGGIYTTCDAEHPHFYLKMSKAQLVNSKNGKKVIIGPSYLYLEDVPLPIVLPFGFFPVMSEQNSGVIIPEFGEENLKGFYLRGGGYYFVLNDYMDLAVRGGIYSYGSWEGSANSTYRKRYKYNGNFGLNYSKDIFGEKGSTDYTNMSNYSITWSHQQDPKFKPNSTFSASVNYTSSQYNKYDATSLTDYVSAQTNSSIAYSKTWAGTPFSFSTNIQQSTNNRDSTVMLSLPNFVFNVNKIFPFRRKNIVGKLRWYENIGFTYNGTFKNSVTTKQDQLFSSEMFDQMQYGMQHTIPVSTSMNVLKYLNLTPSINYNERWYFNKVEKSWDATNQEIVTDTVGGFNRVYDYRFSLGFSTKVYGMAQFNGKDPIVKAIRHVLTPTVSMNYTPNFGADNFGYYKQVQSDSLGNMTTYSPYENGIYGVPGSGESASMSFSLGNNLEMKVRSRSDTLGEKKVKIFESLNISSSYNFLADSLNLAPFSLSARTTLFNSFGINLSATLDPYSIDEDGRKYNRFLVQDGPLARLTSMSLSFGYSFRSVFGLEGGTGSDALGAAPTAEQQSFFAENQINAVDQQQYLSNKYYDFSVPWNLSFNYSLAYSKPAHTANVTQTLGFNGSVNLTSKFGITFNGGYDFTSKALTPGNVNLTRDLHCWQMTFSWVPIGFRKSWNFTIRVKSGMLSDLKYEKSSGYLDNASYYD